MFAFALGLAQLDSAGQPLAVFYPEPCFQPAPALAAALTDAAVAPARVTRLSPRDLGRLRSAFAGAGAPGQAPRHRPGRCGAHLPHGR